MNEQLDALRYMSYMRARWRWVAASSVLAISLALAASLLLPREYTATARIVIEPPAGADLRAATAVSPIYLESLRTYEHFAAGDSIFEKAIDRFSLRKLLGARPIESLKRRVLKVGIVRNTRILEIAATLPDPRKSQALAQFIAESTVGMNRSLVIGSDRELLQGIEQQEHEVRAGLQEAEAAWTHVISKEPVEGLQSAMEKTAELRSSLEQQVVNVEQEIADAAERRKGAEGPELAEIGKQDSIARARLVEMRRQLQAMDRESAGREQLLAERLAHRDRLEAERKARQAGLAAIEARLRDARAEAGYRGERLTIIDPGIVPERPSSPNIPLNVSAALLLGLILPAAYFALEFGYRQAMPERYLDRMASRFETYAKTRDE